MELKRVGNSSSVLQYHSGVPPNDHEGISLIPFSTPEIYRGVSGDACHALSRMASAMRRGSATVDVWVANRFTQDTAAELSQYSPTCL